MQKFYRVLASYPSGLKKPVTIKPGNTRVICERAVDKDGKPLTSVTIEETDDGYYVVETGTIIQYKRYLLPLILDMSRAIHYIGMKAKNRLGIQAAEWPIDVTPISEFYPELINASLDENGAYVDSNHSIIQPLNDDPSRISKDKPPPVIYTGV